jgi:hypothetical protein
VLLSRLPETYQWVLAPEQKDPKAPIVWNTLRLSGSDALAVRATKKLKSEELLLSSIGATILRDEVDKVPLWRGKHVSVRQLVEDYASYPYLSRVTGPEVLLNAIRDGVALLTWEVDTFAFADGYDETAKRYRGLRAGQGIAVSAESTGLIVEPGEAKKQLDAEAAARGAAGGAAPVTPGPGSGPGQPGPGATSGDGTKAPALPKRFYGTVRLDAARAGRDASRIADEVIAHLAGQLGAEVTVTLEIEAKLPGGASEQIVRTVMENSRTLRFSSHGFERE